MREVEHEIHGRRLSRNVGTGLALLFLVVLIGTLTVVKLREQMFDRMAEQATIDAATAEPYAASATEGSE